MAESTELTYRQHERFEVIVEADVTVCEPYRTQVTFARTTGSPHVLPATATDIGAGGLRLQVNVFLPRLTEVDVRLFDPIPNRIDPDGTKHHDVVFEQRAKVRRIEMSSDTYVLGMSFEDAGEEMAQRFNAALEQISASMQQAAELRLAESTQEPPEVA